MFNWRQKLEAIRPNPPAELVRRCERVHTLAKATGSMLASSQVIAMIAEQYERDEHNAEENAR